MLSNADDALYRAKQGARNRLEMGVANPESPETELVSASQDPDTCPFWRITEHVHASFISSQNLESKLPRKRFSAGTPNRMLLNAFPLLGIPLKF